MFGPKIGEIPDVHRPIEPKIPRVPELSGTGELHSYLDELFDEMSEGDMGLDAHPDGLEQRDSDGLHSVLDELFDVGDEERSFSEKTEHDVVSGMDAEENLEKEVKDYFNDLKSKSECPDTIEESFDASDLEKLPPEEVAKRREEFDEKRTELKRQWEEKYGRPWPKYEHDVFSASGKLIRKAGSDYDAHHIQPLCMGGENKASNITPLHAEVHYDKQGVHSPDSPYSKLDRILGGKQE